MFESLDMARFRGERIGIATGGSSLEREISLQTGRAFQEALTGGDYEVTTYDVATDLDQIVEDGPAAMLLGIHGGLGEAGALQGFLESLKIPYTGSGVLASAVAMDKARARILFDAAGIPVAPARRIEPDEAGSASEVARSVSRALEFPVVAKLNDAGSSFGVHICDDHAELLEALGELEEHLGTRASSAILVEQFIEGPEYTVGYFDDHCLGVMEIRPDEGFYDFQSKYESDHTEYAVVGDEAISAPLKKWAGLAIRAVGCRGVARVDFKGDPTERSGAAILEINTIPGMTATSLVPKLAAHRGVDFATFVEAMLAAARLDDQ